MIFSLPLPEFYYYKSESQFLALRVEAANLIYISAYILRRLYKVADFVMEC